jgi:hypothetical protein
MRRQQNEINLGKIRVMLYGWKSSNDAGLKFLPHEFVMKAESGDMNVKRALVFSKQRPVKPF